MPMEIYLSTASHINLLDRSSTNHGSKTTCAKWNLFGNRYGYVFNLISWPACFVILTSTLSNRYGVTIPRHCMATWHRDNV